MAAKNTLDYVRRSLLLLRRPKGFEGQIASNLQVVEAAPGRAVCTMPIEERHLNRVDSLHGGVIASLVDIGGSLAISSMGCYLTGVSTDLSVSYLSGSKIGDTITIDSRCTRIGKTLAFTTVDILHGERLLAQGRHTKFIGKSLALQKQLEHEGVVPPGGVATGDQFNGRY
ncbi:putative PaaI_thioesterase family protein [Thamnocephalis sphaerospora]|uniref:Acyl-coenzyme A thioesterase 13 n=1 Tax=Thamnocephalis sphaerospora TaxID=78915 RepID=A0A4P9XIY8_9FUNG|nr:putative PaaI_thioesterase family protein [Thamnocephalis sphaerospora]|eukprot:RKP05703.1 putative PaaI_thioesterase family protein [Thamnocephalis sphaerospora]